jgi:hypothetical protein
MVLKKLLAPTTISHQKLNETRIVLLKSLRLLQLRHQLGLFGPAFRLEQTLVAA